VGTLLASWPLAAARPIQQDATCTDLAVQLRHGGRSVARTILRIG
jgi:hypothetical protein